MSNRQLPVKLRDDALKIWRAGVDAVVGNRLVSNFVQVSDDAVHFGQHQIDLNQIDRIAVVGAGKAAFAMALGLEKALEKIADRCQIFGIVNVSDDLATPQHSSQMRHIELRGVRQPSQNFPTQKAVEATADIIRLLQSLTNRDVGIILLSGGGSAMLTAPKPPVTVDEKADLARIIFDAGANIQQVNIVRQQISEIKGGRLLHYCHCQRIISLIISDVPGNPLDLIASGPTVPDDRNHSHALEVLSRFDQNKKVARSIYKLLQQSPLRQKTAKVDVHNFVIADNETAVRAAEKCAIELGYLTQSSTAKTFEPDCNRVGQQLADKAIEMAGGNRATAFISGGEPVVKLAQDHGQGGRNQQLVLAALSVLLAKDSIDQSSLNRICLLSGGTDGEDGPTPFAGAWINGEICAATRQRSDLDHSLAINDAMNFFLPFGNLIKTGPTNTNVCDLRVVLAAAPDNH